MSSDSEAREWFYSDTVGGAQKGPVPSIVLCRLLEKGVGVSAQTLVWKAGMDSWLPMSNVEPFKSIAEFNSMQWYYIDIEGQQHGPVLSKLLVHKLKEGDIDGLSLVYGGDSTTEWRKVSDVQVLKKEMTKIAAEEEAMRVAFLQSENANELQNQVFVTDFDHVKALHDSMTTTDTATGVADKKTYTADNGLKYVWDDEEGDWVEAEEDDVSVEAPVTAENAQKKRKADNNDDSDEEPEHTEQGDAKNGAAAAGNAANTGEVKPKKKRSKKKAKKGPNTWVYVSGLPPDITAEEIKSHFAKVGLIALSPYDQQPKIKIYREGAPDSTGDPNTALCKGDCLLCYNAEESVSLAVDILNGGFIRANSQITVTRADFQPAATATDSHRNGNGAQHGESAGKVAYRPSLSQAQVKVARSAIKQALTWNEDDDIGVSKAAALRIVVLEGLFKPSDFANPTFSDELEADIASECEKIGILEKLTFFSSNPRGIAVVKFSTSYAAQECIRVMNGRYFGGQRLKSYFWDGVTNYSVTGHSDAHEEELEKQEASRLDEFGDWLEQEQEELPEEFRLRTE